MRYSKHRRLILWIGSLAILILGIVGTVFTLVKNSSTESPKTEETETKTDAYYNELLSNSFDLDTDYSGFLQYTYDTVNRTATLVGFNDVVALTDTLATNYANYAKALVIPSTIIKDAATYRVTAIDFTDFYNGSTLSGKYQSIAHFITGLTIPKSVLTISENAFAAFGSLEYFETPFIGTERGSSAWYLNNVLDGTLVKESKPFVSMFDNDKLDAGTFCGWNVSETGSVSSKKIVYKGETIEGYVPATWYESTTTAAKPYRVPIDLTKIVVTDEYHIGNHAFFDLINVQTLEISANSEFLESNFINVGQYSISGLTSLTSLSLPITEKISFTNAIGFLEGCSKLKEVRFPGTTYIPESCFADDIALTTVFLPSGTQEIDNSAFSECTSLKNIYFYSVSAYTEDSTYTTLSEGTIDFTSTLTKIGTAAFKNCQLLKDISVHENVTEIGAGAFTDCNSLVSMSLPFVGGSQGSTGEAGFFGYIFGGTSSTGSYAALQKYSDDVVKTSYIPSSLETIRITNETSISTGAFHNLAKVKYLYLPTTCSSIASGALNGMSTLYHLEVPSTSGHIGVIFGTTQYNSNDAYSASGYYIPSTLYEINLTNQSTVESDKFNNMISLRTVVIGEATQVINSNIFFNNPNLNSLTLPFVGRQRGYFGTSSNGTYAYRYWWWRDKAIRDSFQWIFSGTSSDNTFVDHSLKYYDSTWYSRYIPISLKKVTITDDTYLSGHAFEYQSYIENLTISAEHIDEGALKGMARLTTLSVPYIGYDANTNSYNGRNRTLGFIFGDYDGNHSYTYESHYGFNIPNTLAVVSITGDDPCIPQYAFQNCKSLVTVNIAGTIRSFGAYSFYNCTSLSALTIPSQQYTSIGAYAFYNDSKIYDYYKIDKNKNVTSVGAYAFYATSVGGTGHEIDFTQFATIGNYAFGNCAEILAVELSTNNTSIGTGAFSGCTSLTDVTLAGIVSPYMFAECHLLEKINFNISGFKVNAIPEGIFKNCYNLKYAPENTDDGFVLSTETTSIGAYAFYGCSTFDRFVIPVTCTSIGTYAFSKCTGLSYMIIPHETKFLSTNGWDNCDTNFYFYVYKPEAQWPTTWPDNWNCGYPVYIIGDVNEYQFTYEYSTEHKGYFITGVEDGITLTGQITLPSRHNGLNVYGVSNTNTASPLSSQIGITSIIVPKTMYYIASSYYSEIAKGAFQTGHRIDVYFEATKAQIAAYHAKTDPSTYDYGWETGDTTYDDYLGTPSDYEMGLISYGLIFYGDSWEYINITDNSKAPAIKASCLYFDFKFSNQDYTAYQIKADSLNEIVYGTAIQVGTTPNLDSWTGKIRPAMFSDDDDYTKMFTSNYSNNVNAGTATITNVLSKGLYNSYIEKLKNYPLYISGNNKYNFTIYKAVVDLYWNASNKTVTEITDVVYSGSEWRNSTWNTGNVLGLDAFGASFSGTLATRSENSGIYSSTIEGGLGNFYWASDYRITRSGVNITDNFDVYLYLTVVINKMRVTITWEDDTPSNDTEYLEYRYNGSTRVLPRAYATKVDYNYSDNTSTTEAAKSKFTTTKITDCELVIINDDDYTDVLVPGDTLYKAFAYLTSYSTRNYLLVYPSTHANAGEAVPSGNYTADYNKNTYTALTCQYKIIKGLVIINIDLTGDNAYMIGTDEDYWSIAFNSSTYGRYVSNGYLSGLGTDTIFLANYRTKDIDKTDPANYRIDPNTDEKIYLGDKQQVYNINNNDIIALETQIVVEQENGDPIAYGYNAAFHFYRLTSDNQAVVEDDYYDLVINKFRVQIKYSSFETEYYIVQTDELYNPLTDATPLQVYPTAIEEEYTEKGVTKTRTVQNLTYAVDGYYYLMYVTVPNSSEITNFSQTYLIEDGQGSSNSGLFFREANEEYFFGATLSGRHYNQSQIPIRLKTIKSDVTFADDLNKEYDREAYDLLDYITKRDMVSDPAQEITIEYFEKDIINDGYKELGFTSLEAFLASDYVEKYKLSGGPIDVGSYAAIVNATETAYFNPLKNKIVYFDVIKRRIYIDVTGAGCKFEEGTITGSRKYNGEPQTFTPTNETLTNLGYMLPAVKDEDGVVVLGNDIFSGILRTKSAVPGVYSSSVSGDFVWDTEFKVISSLGVDNTSNYQVIIVGDFEILNLDFGITEHNVDCQYDGSTKYAYISITLDSAYSGTDLGYTIYYSKDYEIDTEKLGNYQIGIPPQFTTPTDGVVEIYYYITGTYYNSQSGKLTVNITLRDITYNDPATTVDGLQKYVVEFDNEYHEYIVTVSDPWYATVYYSTDNVNWQTEPFMLKDVNKGDPLPVYYKIEAEFYETVSKGPIYFVVTDEGFDDLDPAKYYVTPKTVTYNGNAHSIGVYYDTTTTDPVEISYSTDGETWQDSVIEYTKAGTYEIYVRYYLKMHKILITHATLKINKLSFIGLGIETKIGDDAITFDGKYHTLNVTGKYFSYEDVQIIGEDPTVVETVRKYYYTDPNTGIKEEVTLTYSNNIFSIDAGYGFDEEMLEYKNASSTPYIIIIKISNDNYEDCIVGDGNTTGLLQINVAPGVGTYKFTEVQYSKTTFNPSELSITTVHDGVRTFRYWAAYYDADNNMVCDFDEQVADPRELGLYCFMVSFTGSKNVESFIMGANNNTDTSRLLFFEIVPKKLTVEYLEEAYYSGEPFDPAPTVETGTSDDLVIDYTLIKTVIDGVTNTSPDTDLEPTEVGEYTYSISIHSGNPNYVLDKYEITMSIVKRSVDVSVTDEKVYDALIYSKSNLPSYDYENDSTYTYYEWGQFTGLLPQHKVVMTLQTSRAVITSYTKTYGTVSYATNRVNLIDFDIVLMKPVLDENGNNTYDADGNVVYEYAYDTDGNLISVANLYDVTGEFLIKITKQKFDIESFSETIPYDGYSHTLKVFNSRNYVGDMAPLAGATVYCIKYDDKGTAYIIPTPPSYTSVGVYEYDIQVIKSGYETSYATLTLTIEPAELEVTISDLCDVTADYEIYDGLDKNTVYTVDNINPSVITIFGPTSDTTAGSIRYYSVSDYSMAELVEFYNDFDETNPIFVNSYATIASAGDYYCVVYYKESTYQWQESVTIKKITLAQRPIDVILYSGDTETPEKQYDKAKLVISLGGYATGWTGILPKYSFDTNDLVSGHYIDDSFDKMSTYSVRTISANAGTYYGATGFEFNNMLIYDASANNVVSNYRPVLSDNVTATITKAYLTPDLFKVSGNTKYYDTYEGEPIIDTDSDGSLICYYQVYTDYDSNVYKANKISGLPTNVGYYRVSVGISAGTNYYSSNDVNPVTGAALGYQIVDIIIKQATIDVIWDNENVVFDGSTQTRTATIEEANGNIVYLHVYYYTNIAKGTTVDGYASAGAYQAYAEFANGVAGNPTTFSLVNYQANYTLDNEMATFTISPVSYVLNIGNIKTKLPIDTKWTGPFDTTMIDDFPTEVLTLSGSTGTSPQVSTINSAPGIYSTTDLFKFAYSVTNNSSGEDVTKSVQFVINGSVEIEANTVPCTYEDQTLTYQYGGYTFASLNALTISSSLVDSCDVTYQYYATAYDTSYTRPPDNTFVLEDVGVYEIEVTISCSGYQNTYLTIKIEIVQKDAFVTFQSSLTKTYDGIAVDASGLVSSTEISYGFNGYYSDLIYTYYRYNGEIGSASYTQLESAPISAGNYFVLVTCKENKVNSNGLKDYTELSKTSDFQIKAKQITLSVQLDETLEVSDVGASWNETYFYEPSKTNYQLASYDYLYINFSLSEMARAKYYADITLNDKKAPDSYESSFTGTVYGQSIPNSYLQTTFVTSVNTDTIDEEDRTWGVKWLIYRAVDSETAIEDVTVNYDITLDFDAYFHLELIKGYTVTGVGTAAGQAQQAYTGSYYSGTLTVDSNATPGVTTYYSTNESYFDDGTKTAYVYSSISNENISYKLPGKSLVYYKFTAGSGYEPYTGYYYIDIEKIDSPLYINDSLTKTYDATTMYTDYLNTGIVLPALYYENKDGNPTAFNNTGSINFTVTNGSVSDVLNDTVTTKDISVLYKSGSLVLDGTSGSRPIDAGVYNVTITIPETTHCLETTLETSITIAKRTILVVDKDSTTPANSTYNTNYGVYTDFSSTNSYYDLYYVNNDNTRTLLSDTGDTYNITGTIVTSGRNVGTYKGSNSSAYKLSFTTTPIVEVNGSASVSNNFSVSLANATYAIYAATQTIYDVTPSDGYNYDGQYHTIIIQRAWPTTGTVYCYHTSSDTWIALDNDTNNYFHFADSTTSPGNLVKWKVVAANYEDYYGETYVMINAIETTVSIDTALGKVYDGQEVLVPETVTTNSTNTDSSTYTYTYYEWAYSDVTKKYGWAEMASFKKSGDSYVSLDPALSVTRPVNVGSYMVEVTVPAVNNYSEGIGSKEFEITAMGVNVVWGTDTLIYNGQPQSVKAQILQANGTYLTLPTTIVPLAATGGDTTHTAIGSYQATADVSTISANYSINSSSTVKTFTITKKPLLIQLNQSVTYTGEEQVFDIYSSTNTNGYYATGLCVDSTAGVLHNIYGSLALSKTLVRSRSYKLFGTANDYYWKNNGLDGDTCVILDENGNQVQTNYSITYNLSVTINFSNISISVEGSAGYADVEDTNWTYIYEPNTDRYITVTVLNSDAENYVVLYSNEENGSYTKTPLKYTNVAGTSTDPGCYTVYYRVYKSGDSGLYTVATSFTNDQAYYSITEETITDTTFVANKYYRLSTSTGRYELASDYISGSTYYTIVEVKDLDATTFALGTYYVSMDGYPPINGSATITITPKNASLSFDNPLLDLSKTYDGVAIKDTDHPVSCEDETATFVYRYYYYDADAENYKGSLVSANGIPSNPVNAGKYVMEVSISGHSDNYKSAAIKHVFEIYERNVIINVGPVTKVFDYKVWSESINNSYILMNDNGTYVSGIASGQTFTGILDTTSYVIGKYTDFSTNFKWRTSSAENGYAIYDSSLNDVSDNYNLSYNLSVSITKAPISVTVDCPVLTYDAEEHSITVTVVDSVYGDVTYPKPKNYVIYYKVEGGTYTTNNPKFRLAGTYPVYVMVVADNYATLEFSNGSVGVGPNGNEITYNSYVQIDGVSFEGGYLDYAGRTEETNFYYCGSHYPTPMYIDSPSTGEQTVKYYTEDVYLLYRNALIAAEAEALAKSSELTDSEKAELKATYLDPHEIAEADLIDAGKYHFILTIASDGIYDEQEFNASFEIYKKEIVISWKDITTDEDTLTMQYTGENLAPTAYFTRVDGTKVALDVKFVMDLSDNTEITEASKVGRYQVKASIVDSADSANYELLDPERVFTITKKSIPDVLIPDDLTVIYGDDLVIKDTEGNTLLLDDEGHVIYKVPSTHVVFVDEDGNTCVGIDNGDGTYSDVTKVINADGTLADGIEPSPYTITVDTEGDVGTHTIEISLDDPDNNVWEGQKDSKPLTYTYEVTPITIPDSSGRFSVNISLDKSTMVIGDAKPVVTVKVIDSEKDNAETVLVLDTDYTATYVDEENWEALIEESTDGKITAEIKIVGKGNYSISAAKQFTIVAAAPDILLLDENADMYAQFIKAKYDVAASETKYLENEEAPERTVDNYKSDDDGYKYYLSHIHQDTYVDVFLTYFSNPSDRIKFFTRKDYTTKTVDDDGNEILKYQIQASEYRDTLVGTGLWVVLYDDKDNPIDEIQCIVFGDADGNGLINPNDFNVIKKFLVNKLTLVYDDDVPLDTTEEVMSLTQYLACVTDRDVQTDVGLGATNDIKIYLSTTKYLVKGIDFNYDYLSEAEKEKILKEYSS